MKTIEELFNEVKANEKLKEEGIAAIQEGKLGAFMKAHGEKAGIPLFFL